MRILILIALRNLLGARRRSALLGTAVGMVTLILVLMLSLTKGIEDNLIEGATTLSTGHINVAGFYKSSPGESIPVVTHLSEIKQIVEENTPGLDYVIDRSRGWGKIISDTGSMQVGLNGIDAAQESRFFDKIHLAPLSDYVEGGDATEEGDLRRIAEPNTVMLFAAQAKKLGVRVGDQITVQTETFGGRTNTIDATIIGVARDQGLLSNWAVFVPRSATKELYQFGEDTTGAVWVYLKDHRDAEATMEHLREVFAEKGFRVMDHEANPFWMKFETVQGEDWTGQKLDLTIWRDEVNFLTYVLTGFNFITSLLLFVLVVLIVIGISNTMWNAVRERTKEIGTMRAIGMTRPRVLALFLLEALFLGLFATTAGALFGAAVAFGIDSAHVAVPSEAVRAILLSNELNLVIDPGTLVTAIVFLTLFTGISALWPAVRAALLQPVKALQHAE